MLVIDIDIVQVLCYIIIVLYYFYVHVSGIWGFGALPLDLEFSGRDRVVSEQVPGYINSGGLQVRSIDMYMGDESGICVCVKIVFVD